MKVKIIISRCACHSVPSDPSGSLPGTPLFLHHQISVLGAPDPALTLRPSGCLGDERAHRCGHPDKAHLLRRAPDQILLRQAELLPSAAHRAFTASSAGMSFGPRRASPSPAVPYSARQPVDPYRLILLIIAYGRTTVKNQTPPAPNTRPRPNFTFCVTASTFFIKTLDNGGGICYNVTRRNESGIQAIRTDAEYRYCVKVAQQTLTLHVGVRIPVPVSRQVRKTCLFFLFSSPVTPEKGERHAPV